MGDFALSGLLFPPSLDLALGYYDVYVSLYIENCCKTIDEVNDIACKYYEGNELQQNHYVAFLFWKQIEEYKDLIALDNLGHCYQFGHGTQQDTTKAIECFELPAQENDDYALYNLGLINWDPDYGINNDPKAIEYWIRATGEGNDDAKESLMSIYNDHHPFVKKFHIINAILWLSVIVTLLLGFQFFSLLFVSLVLLVVAAFYTSLNYEHRSYSFKINKILRSFVKNPPENSDGNFYCVDYDSDETVVKVDPSDFDEQSEETQSENLEIPSGKEDN